MPNMSYCRFENTLQDLQDCLEHLDDDTNDLSDRERKAKKRLIDLCYDIGMDYVNKDDEDED